MIQRAERTTTTIDSLMAFVEDNTGPLGQTNGNKELPVHTYTGHPEVVGSKLGHTTITRIDGGNGWEYHKFYKAVRESGSYDESIVYQGGKLTAVRRESGKNIYYFGDDTYSERKTTYTTDDSDHNEMLGSIFDGL